MVINELCLEASNQLTSVADAPLREARILLAHVLNMSVTDIIAKHTLEVSADDEKLFRKLLSKRKNHMPMAYITGTQEFYGLNFKVREGVLIPRPDTEILTEFAINSSARSFIDICTGSGCIAIALTKNRHDAFVAAVDVSDTALSTAFENSCINNAAIAFEKVDILKKLPYGKYDMIVSNPPYIPENEMDTLMPDVKNFEPYEALCGGSDGLIFYRRICNIAPEILHKDGILAFEIGYNQYDAVKEIMSQGFRDIGFKCDFAGIKRVIFGTLDN